MKTMLSVFSLCIALAPADAAAPAVEPALPDEEPPAPEPVEINEGDWQEGLSIFDEADAAISEPDPAPALDPFSAGIVRAHARYQSWRERLYWIRDTVSAPDFAGGPEQLASLAIYLRFLGTGELRCAEDGRHFRPHHHARKRV